MKAISAPTATMAAAISQGRAPALELCSGSFGAGAEAIVVVAAVGSAIAVAVVVVVGGAASS